MKSFFKIVFLFPSLFVFGEPLDNISIWPKDVPGEKKGEVEPEKTIPPENDGDVLRISNVSQPSMTIFPADPKIANQTAVLVCPGGGYNILAYEHEGIDVCKWLNSFGVTGVLLKYRVPRRIDRGKHEAPLQDAQR
ncbi:MAG: alpha/beta hydrolase, partial [Verrucomicrobiia bacterium]